MNPKSTLGLTAIVVIVVQAIAMLFEVVPLAASDRIWMLRKGFITSSKLVEIASTNALGGVAIAVVTTLLLGMLTVVVEHAIFGYPITIGVVWHRIRMRIWVLLRLALLVFVLAIIFVAVAWILLSKTVARSEASLPLFAIVVGVILAIIATYASALLVFAPVAVVLECKSVFAAICRSISLLHRNFWRSAGILALGGLVTGALGMALAVPFGLADGIILATGHSTGATVLAAAVSAVGSAVGQIIVVPFTAGVVVLLYTDLRMRFEKFDSVLTTCAEGSAEAYSAGRFWVPRDN